MAELLLATLAAVLVIIGRTLGSIRVECEWWAAEAARDRLFDAHQGGRDG